MFNKRQKSKTGNVACIFVHAGAGFHSEQNEATHLQACNDAVKSAMAVLKAGGSALDAVEIAIKVLEDREITNAGYGSNLTMDGVVECDAVMVDHNGRSGGVGAVSQVKNPVSLARLLLDLSATELSLRRVPPNFLVGQGATDFAWSHGISLVPHDVLISPNARSRWTRWKADLRAAAQRARVAAAARAGLSPSPEPDVDIIQTYEHDRVYGVPMEQSLFNDAQPMSPPASEAVLPIAISSTSGAAAVLPSTIRNDSSPSSNSIKPRQASALHRASTNPFMNSTQNILEHPNVGDGLGHVEQDSLDQVTGKRSMHFEDTRRGRKNVETALETRIDQPDIPSSLPGVHAYDQQQYPAQSPNIEHTHYQDAIMADTESGPSKLEAIDNITDTVGAIAIDLRGNIACAASSGGIGMKHRGRVGPAALVGIGACVIPAHASDPPRTTVASVTSGTGEHMTTTQAASVCSSRILNSQRRSADGDLQEVTEDEAIRAFIEKDFMNHPSVTHSSSAGAIGVLSVKKTQDGAWLYFAHNTDSFALASMSSNDSQPVTTMSRNKGNGGIAGGGRAIKFAARSKAMQ